MISRSANSSSRNGSTASRVEGPPRLSMTMPVLTRLRLFLTGSTAGAAVCSVVVGLLTDQSCLECEACQARDRPNSQLPHQTFPVGLDGAMADPQRAGDLLV